MKIKETIEIDITKEIDNHNNSLKWDEYHLTYYENPNLNIDFIKQGEKARKKYKLDKYDKENTKIIFIYKGELLGKRIYPKFFVGLFLLSLIKLGVLPFHLKYDFSRLPATFAKDIRIGFDYLQDTYEGNVKDYYDTGNI